ncbi:hypothetical protein [Demequina subtropica]|uniref:hypothetical protein n=1 Tax=Demequina subtropica TaxID=1638989 RepID=UPI000785A521|nr:hypothetical protein [Demequina subtropica]
MRTLVIVAAAAVLLAGCASAQDDAPGGSASPVATPACPETIEVSRGAYEPAAAAPEIGAFDSAWLCTYGYLEDWELLEGPVVIEDLAAVREIVDGLEPADVSLPCTMELGPELVLTLADGEDLTSLVIDTYGCRWVQVEGEEGLLSGSDTLLADLDALVTG